MDFDLHGLAGIRLVGASPGDLAGVRRQLGLAPGSLDREPDVVIRFVDRVAARSRVRLLGLGEAAFTDDAFLVLRSRHKAPARVEIDLAQIGEVVEIVCESGLPAVPFLIPILNLTVLARGALPLHASSFVYGGTGVVATGWTKGGKTEALLAFTSRGARYVADEWAYVTADGSSVHGIPEPIRIWGWQLRQLPQYEALVGRAERGRLRAVELVLGSERALRRARVGRRPSRALARLAPLLSRQLCVDVEPERIFGDVSGRAAPFDRLFFLVSSDDPDIAVEPVDPLDVGARMAFSLQHERLDFTAALLKYRFAFPEAANPFFEQVEELERQALARVLAGKRAYVVYHPYPVSLDALFAAMSPYCEG
ncbi:MAG TPA: hypothetical protein VH650_00740 [Gaiellaceae bacterium]